jgi:DNA-binding CsgD family transcriptional regulator
MTPDAINDELADLFLAADAELRSVVLPGVPVSERDRADAIHRLSARIRRPVHIRRWPAVADELDQLGVPRTDWRDYLGALVEQAITEAAGPVLVAPVPSSARPQLLRYAVNVLVTRAVLGHLTVEEPTAPDILELLALADRGVEHDDAPSPEEQLAPLRPKLTPKECDVVDLAVCRPFLPPEEAAAILGTTYSTLRVHLHNIRKKLAAS